MEKRSSTERNDKRVKVEIDVPVEPEAPAKQELSPKTVLIRSLRYGKINTVGKVTGRRYTFDGAGSSILMDHRDAEYLLTLRSGRGCCSSGRTPYFETVI